MTQQRHFTWAPSQDDLWIRRYGDTDWIYLGVMIRPEAFSPRFHQNLIGRNRLPHISLSYARQLMPSGEGVFREHFLAAIRMWSPLPVTLTPGGRRDRAWFSLLGPESLGFKSFVLGGLWSCPEDLDCENLHISTNKW